MPFVINNVAAGTASFTNRFVRDLPAYEVYIGVLRTVATAYSNHLKGNLYALHIYQIKYTIAAMHYLTAGCMTTPCYSTRCPATTACMYVDNFDEYDGVGTPCDATCATATVDCRMRHFAKLRLYVLP